MDGQVRFVADPKYYHKKYTRIDQIMKNRPKEADYN